MSGEAWVTVLGVLALICAGVFLDLRRPFSTSRTASPEPHQPVPDVTPDDLERVIRRDFRYVPLGDVMAILNGYTSRWKGPTIRVQLSALKLANGDLDSLRRHIAAATQDYRDVLIAAEYPEYWKATCRSHKLEQQERRRLVEADWKQYESWLLR